MKLIIQVPCFNEEQTLAATLADLPRHVAGFDRVEWLIINDGSRDNTVEVARACGVDHIVSFPQNRGLAAAFMAGLQAALRAGADVIVNTDADNQYCAADIPKLVAPILRREADLVVGARPIRDLEHFSPLKKLLQLLGSWVVRRVSRTNVADTPSGFRAFSREAALQLNVFNRYTYTLETLIQAGQKGMLVASVPIRTNPPTRPSRLVRSIPSYVARSVATIARIVVLYRPLQFFFWCGVPLMLAGGALFVRWLVLRIVDDTYESRLPSLVLGAVLLLSGLCVWCFAVVADLLAANRRLLEECQLHLRERGLHADPAAAASHPRTPAPETTDPHPGQLRPARLDLLAD